MNPLDGLVLGPPYPHQSGAITFTTSSTTYSGADAADYVTTGTGGGTVDPGAAAFSCFRFVTVCNNDPSAILYVTVGTTLKIPPAATAGCFAIGPGQRYTFAIPGAGSVPGVQGYVQVLASASASGSIQWHP